MLNSRVHALLGGMVRNFCECYNRSGIIPGIREGMNIEERAQATIAVGCRTFRFGVGTPANTTYNTHQKTQPDVRRVHAADHRSGTDLFPAGWVDYELVAFQTAP